MRVICGRHHQHATSSRQKFLSVSLPGLGLVPVVPDFGGLDKSLPTSPGVRKFRMPSLIFVVLLTIREDYEGHV